MIYLFYGEEQLLINNAINKIINDNNIDEVNISRYNLEEVLLQILFHYLVIKN